MDQLPRMCELLSPAVSALLGDLSGDRRSARERAANTGRFGDVLRGWRGQAEVIRARLASEIMATRLDGCEGQELADLAHSEYLAELPGDSQKAIGEGQFRRFVVNASSLTTGNFTATVIPVGAKLNRPADTSTAFALPQADYQTTREVALGTGDSVAAVDNGDGTWTHYQLFELAVEATREGPAANYPVDVSRPTMAPPFANTECTFFKAAGGTLGVVDEQVAALARAMAVGSNGPTHGAAVAGALTNSGVRHAVYVDNPTSATGRLFIADESWATSGAYAAKVLSAMRQQKWLGWGCKVLIGTVRQTGVSVKPTVLLRSPDFEPFQEEITANIRTALREYFDDRPDWYTWTLNAIGATVGGADQRILACTAVTVNDGGGSLIAEVDSTGFVTGTEPDAEISGSLIDHSGLLSVAPLYQTPGD